MFTVLIAFYGLDDFPSHQLRMYGGLGPGSEAVTWGQGTTRSFSLPAPQRHPPASCLRFPCSFGQESMQQTCSEPGTDGAPGPGRGRAHSPPVVMAHSPRLPGLGREPQEFCTAVHCMRCPPTWPPPWVALPMH